MFALGDLETGALVGFIGIVHPGGQAEAEIKYALAHKYWGKGLATEAVKAITEYASVAHGLTYLIATTAPENEASHRVLLKSGFVRGRPRVNDDGRQTLVFEWRASGPLGPTTTGR